MRKITSILFFAISTSAFAGDFNWAGPYAGLNAGDAQNNNKTKYNYTAYSTSETDFAAGFGAGDPSLAVANGVASGVLPLSLGSGSSANFIGGGQLGYNWQSNHLVYGIEGDFNFLNSKQNSTSNGMFSLYGGGSFSNDNKSSSEINWLSTIKGRLGYAADNFLVYGTAGVAFGDTKVASSSVGYDGSNYDTFSNSISQIKAGYVVGGGVEYAIDSHWTVRGEGEYYNLGTTHYSVIPQDANSISEAISINASHKFDGELARFAINYRF